MQDRCASFAPYVRTGSIRCVALDQTQEDLQQILKYQQALKENPKSETDIVGLATILFAKEQNEKAIALLEPFVRANPKAYRAALFLRFGYVQEEKYEQAHTRPSGRESERS